MFWTKIIGVCFIRNVSLSILNFTWNSMCFLPFLCKYLWTVYFLRIFLSENFNFLVSLLILVVDEPRNYFKFFMFCLFSICVAEQRGYSTMCEVLIVHTSEAREWAEYLQQILAASCNFPEGSLILYDVNEEMWMNNHELFGSSKCIMLLLSAALLGMQYDTFRDLLQPPCKVVAFLCGVSEGQVSANYFEHWEYWRKLNSEDEPSVYVSTVRECINNGMYFLNGMYIQHKNILITCTIFHL